MNNNNSEEYQLILNHIRTSARVSLIEGCVIVPTILMTARYLSMPLDIVEAVYEELQALGMIRSISEFEYCAGSYFSYTDKLRHQVKELLLN